MCGIVGQIQRTDGVVDPGLLRRMCAALEHRGPDQRGTFSDGRAGLGIQRLAVIDLETGDQPVTNEDGTVTVVLNGEIYNYRDLRRGLLARGHRLRSAGDSETIAHLYEEHGDACVHHLHGMFAFALWDARARRLLLARDRVGKKPLLYAERPGALTFASEMAALLCDPLIPRDPDPVALDRYLAFGYVPAPLGALRAVRKLPPGHRLVLEDGADAPRVERWWRPAPARRCPELADPALLRERIRDELLAATARRLVADVPVGAFLSGGIDSSAVVAAMAQTASGTVRTFSIGFDHDAFDELPQARLVAQRFATEHHEDVVRPDAIALVPRIVRHHGEPFADSSAIPSFHLAEHTRRSVTVALNGDGGDEAFGGYTRYVANRLAGRADVLPLAVRRATCALGARLPVRGSVSGPVSRVRRMATGLPLDPAARYARYVSWFDAAQRDALYTPAWRALLADEAPAESVVAEAWAEAGGRDVVQRMLEVDGATYLPGDLLAKIDIATMAHGLEARSPFLDHELLAFAAAIPGSQKVRGGQKKRVLREALRPWLPDEILDRPKQGFSVPLSAWLAGELRAPVREVLLDPSTLARGQFDERAVHALLARHDAGAEADASRIWSLYMLELWHREFVDVPAQRAAGASRWVG